MKMISRVLACACSLSFGSLALNKTGLIALGFMLCGASVMLPAAEPKLQAYKLEEVQQHPMIKREMHLRFPRGLRKGQDKIVLRFIVTAEGKTTQITVVSFTDPDMIDRAMTAYQNAEYVPAVKDGKAVAVWLEVTEVVK